MLTNRRIGKFNIEIDVINDAPEVVQQVMGDVIVIRAEALLQTNMVEYHALCDSFEEVEDGVVVPEYDLMYDSVTSKIIWTKVG